MKTYYLFDIDRDDYSDRNGNNSLLGEHLDCVSTGYCNPECWQEVTGYESEAIRIAADSGLNIAIIDSDTFYLVTEVFTK